MKTAFRVAALFAIYGAIGYGGDYAVGLLAMDRDVAEPVAGNEVEVEPHFDLVVDVQPEIRLDVQLRHAGECAYTDALALVVPTGGAEGLHIDVGSGDLRVEAHEGDDVRVGAVLCASEEAWLDELRVTAEEGPGGIRLVAHYPERRGWSDGDNTARIDLTVSIPSGFVVSIDDSSGDIEVSGTGHLRIVDSSGSITVRAVAGHVSIDDSSGDLDIRDVAGDVEIEDGSGGLSIRDVQGSVALRDGSGGIEIEEIGQDVLIESDGSGSIDVRAIGGDFVVDRDGSGSIRCADVEGEVLIPAEDRYEDERRRRRRRPCR